MQTSSGKARLARLCISVCVNMCEFSLGMQVLHAFADASFMLFFNFSPSPGFANTFFSDNSLARRCNLLSF